MVNLIEIVMRQEELINPRGFYHYAYPQYNLPEEEANYFLSVLNDLQKDELMALDFEESEWR